jgi:hypothetical protein
VGGMILDLLDEGHVLAITIIGISLWVWLMKL